MTTGTFSIPVQHEVIEDQYPHLLINGSILASIILRIAEIAGRSVDSIITTIDEEYPTRVSGRRPSEILRD